MPSNKYNLSLRKAIRVACSELGIMTNEVDKAAGLKLGTCRKLSSVYCENSFDIAEELGLDLYELAVMEALPKLVPSAAKKDKRILDLYKYMQRYWNNKSGFVNRKEKD